MKSKYFSLTYMVGFKKLGMRLLLVLFGSGHVLDSTGQEITMDARYDHAKVLYAKGLFLSARNEFEKIEQPLYETETQYYIASSAVKAGQKDGEFLIKQFVEQYPSHRFSQLAFFELGNYYFEKGDFENALKYFESSKSGNSDEFNFKVGYSYFQLKKYDESLKSFAKLNGFKNAYEFDAGYFQGYIFYERKEYEKSYKHLKIAFQSTVYKEESLTIYVSALYQLKKYQELITLVEAELPKTENPIIINYVADAHYALKSYRNAKDQYAKLLSTKSKYANEFNYYKAGYSCYKIDQIKEATDYLKRAAVADDTVGAYASYYLGLIYYAEENFPFAVTSFSNTAKYKTKLKEDAMYHLGGALVEVLNYQEAITNFTLYKELFPKGKYTREVNEILSLAYSHTNNYDLAMSYIESLPTITEPMKRIYQRVTFVKASELFNDKKFKEASDIFQKSLIYNADSKITQQCYYWMGECLSVLKNEKEAIFYYKSVKNTDPVLFKKSAYGLGYAYFNQMNYVEALASFSKIENAKSDELDNRYLLDALMRMADCHFALKSYEKSITYYKKSLAAGNKDKDLVYFQIGLLNRYLDRDEEAKSYFSKLISETPDSPKTDQAQFQIAEIDFKLGNDSKAVQSYSVLLTKYPSSPLVPFALLNQAGAYDNLKNNSASIKNYREILSRFPRHEVARSAILALQGKNANGQFDEFEAFFASYKAANPNSDALENIEFENARILFFNQKYDQSITGFETFVKVYPSSALVVEARYFIGDAFYRMTKFDQSLKNFYLIEKNKDFSKRDRVLYRIAEMESTNGNYKKSNEYYHKLAKESPSTRNQIYVERGLMENYLQLGTYDSTIYYGNRLLDNGKIGVIVETSVNLSMGKALYNKKEYDKAMGYFVNLVNNSPDENGAQANYFVAKIHYNQAAYDRSLESLFSLTKQFRQYEYWQAKAFLLMADVYVKTDEVFQAKATLNSLINNSESKEIKIEAQSKLDAINTNTGSQNN